MKRIFLLVALGFSAMTAYGQHPRINDADANGRDIVHLGSVNTGVIYMKPDCTEELADGFKCTVIQSGSTITEFNHPDIISFKVPARAANSLLCFDLTPLMDVVFQNSTPGPVTNAVFSGVARLTIKSPVLNDPTLIRPFTGQPYNGKFDIPTIQYSEQLNLAAGESNSKSYHYTRSCGNAGISKEKLIAGFGFSAAQANSFFNNPITVVLNASAIARHVSYVHYDYHVRLYGDRR